MRGLCVRNSLENLCLNSKYISRGRIISIDWLWVVVLHKLSLEFGGNQVMWCAGKNNKDKKWHIPS